MVDGPLAAVGVIGCGAISDVYFSAISRSPALDLVSVAARTRASAERQASRFGGTPTDVDEMLVDPRIDIVVNLTPAREHYDLNRRVLEAGKHLYTEKPFVLRLAEANELVRLARKRDLRIGSAPDTFFGASHQAARRLIDDGEIGRPIHGAAFVGHPGIEMFHPNPAGFYLPGSEPPYEIGPYYVTQLVNLLGPVVRVAAASARGPDLRTVRMGPHAGSTFSVEVPTSFAALLQFESGPFVTVTMSLDVARHERRPIELYGTDGSLQLCDPNGFGGVPLRSGAAGWEEVDVSAWALGTPNRNGPVGRVADYRGAGIVDMAYAISVGADHRTGVGLVVHVIEVLEAIMRSAAGEGTLAIESRCERPRPIDPDADAAMLSLIRSPHDPV